MIIFLGGIHGVGKSFLGSYAAEKNNLLHKSASQLIRLERGEQSWNDKKYTNEIEANQKALISAISRFKQNHQNLLLDGHFCLIDKDGEITIVEIDVFEQLNLDMLLLLESDIHTLQQRLKVRDEISYADDFLNNFLLKERCQAIAVSEKLNIPLKIMQNPTKDQFDTAVKSIIKEAKKMNQILHVNFFKGELDDYGMPKEFHSYVIAGRNATSKEAKVGSGIAKVYCMSANAIPLNPDTLVDDHGIQGAIQKAIATLENKHPGYKLRIIKQV